MCFIEMIINIAVVIIAFSLLLIIAITHIVFGFLMKANEFNAFDLFDSSPLFDFEVKKDCGEKTALTFHRWGGRNIIETYTDSDGDDREWLKVIDETDIKIINGNYFCYKHISYKDLLNNGQIIKNGKECPSKYPKNCGKLDTLEQELCIKENEKCPIYEVGIGNKPDDINYIYNENSSVYYNNENYTKENKTIIGRLILNDGQPCYYSLEKLWKKFNPNEAVETHLKCDIDIFGKNNDDRYENKGNISYKKLYEDNLNKESKNMILKYLNGEENVSLYERKFLGIDKECDKNYTFTEDSFDSFFSSEKSEKALLLSEGFLLAISTLIGFILMICGGGEFECAVMVCYCICMGIVIPCFICNIVFFYRLKKYDVTGYNYSDSITNELIRKGTEDNDKQVLFVTINFYLDVFIVGINCLIILISFVLSLIDCCVTKYQNKRESNQNNSRELLTR